MTNPKRIEKGMYWDRAWHLVSGCTPVSPSCDHCWAAREAHMRAGQRNEKIKGKYEGLTTEEGRWNGQIRPLEGNLDLPLRVKKSTVWAVWNDLFHEDVLDDFIYEAFKVMAEANWHTFLILTKRPNVLNEIKHWLIPMFEEEETVYNGSVVSWPLPNVWMGVTAENQEQADKRIPMLLQIPAAVSFVSVEPMLGPVEISKYLTTAAPTSYKILSRFYGPMGFDETGSQPEKTKINGLGWVICGGESGPGARPMHLDWARNLRDQCQAADVPYFFKQHGEWIQVGECMNESDDNKFYNLTSHNYPSFRRVNHAGGFGYHGAGSIYMQKVGKKKAGRLLDGVEYNEMPGLGQ